MTGDRAPAIGITCRTLPAAGGPSRVGQNESYVRALMRAGAAPVLLPQLTEHSRLRRLYDALDGLLLPGGEDVDPARYGEARHEKCGSVSPELDEVELTLTRWAVDDGKPVFAICRGIQVLNVALGGTLYQDIAAQIPGGAEHVKHRRGPRDFLAHTAAITPGSRLALILGATSLPVNSLHHQAVKDVAPGLAVVARTPDSLIEALEVSEHPFAIGVQWHPEELVDRDARSQNLFDALVEACRS
jgi:putative glutamine amidotransferase